MPSGFCTDCGEKIPDFGELKGCPKCGSTTIPCDDENQVAISINWHELHLLCVWAENWQRAKVPKSKVIYSIASRIRAQHPDRHPLTLAEDLGNVAKQFGNIQVSDKDLRRDIMDQTGMEPGIIGDAP